MNKRVNSMKVKARIGTQRKITRKLEEMMIWPRVARTVTLPIVEW